jgi:16S rRNA (adenine(1408)-N(1))-methyltransferase
VVDLGTGDGRAVLRAARRDPRTLVIGIDADAASMRRASRAAARPIRTGGLPNALFVVAAVESVPDDLEAMADEVRVAFPWGSLLRGVLGRDDQALGGIARVAKPGAEVRALVSLTERDGLAMSTDPDPAVHRARGLRVVEVRPAGLDEIAAAESSWAKRLRAGVDRPVTLIRALRVGR